MKEVVLNFPGVHKVITRVLIGERQNSRSGKMSDVMTAVKIREKDLKMKRCWLFEVATGLAIGRCREGYCDVDWCHHRESIV